MAGLKCLVTGSRGFLGQHLIQRLRDKNNTIVGIGRTGGDPLSKLLIIREGDYAELNCDITNKEDVCCLLRTFQPHIIYHFGAVPTTKLDELNPTEITTTNIIGTQNLLHYALFIPRFILASSATVYGDTQGYANEDDPLKPTSVYATTKIAAENLVKAYTIMGRVSGLSLRFVANVGKGATHGVLPDVVKKLRSDNPYLELFGDEPGTEKPYMHAKDTIEATIHLAMNTIYTDPINIAPDNSLKIKTLANMVMASLEITKPIRWLGKGAIWAGDNMVVRVNNHILVERFKWKAKYPYSEDAIFYAAREI